MAVCSGVAHAIGYLHAKNIVHGRISSKNVFLEPKVQLSLLDYAGDQSNIIYSSPQIILQNGMGFSMADTKLLIEVLYFSCCFLLAPFV